MLKGLKLADRISELAQSQLGEIRQSTFLKDFYVLRVSFLCQFLYHDLEFLFDGVMQYLNKLLYIFKGRNIVPHRQGSGFNMR